MLRRFSYLGFFGIGILAVGLGSARLEPSQRALKTGPALQAESQQLPELTPARRQDLLETLDRLVAYEHHYRDVYGHFTKLLSRVGYPIPPALLDHYEIRVAEASEDRVLLVAMSERAGKPDEIVSIDQEFRVHANFKLPDPSPEYLRATALRHLRGLVATGGAGERAAEASMFRGYFRYDLGQNPAAVGIKAPVADLKLELDSEHEAEGSVILGQIKSPRIGANSTWEEAYLAQKIFRAEFGRYARNWSELSRIADFKFEDKDRINVEAVALGSPEGGREPAQDGHAAVVEEADSGLVVEPLDVNETN